MIIRGLRAGGNEGVSGCWGGKTPTGLPGFPREPAPFLEPAHASALYGLGSRAIPTLCHGRPPNPLGSTRCRES